MSKESPLFQFRGSWPDITAEDTKLVTTDSINVQNGQQEAVFAVNLPLAVTN